jgi:UDP:flavonoid glycosyltransferase YjiC (YdhE family)
MTDLMPDFEEHSASTLPPILFFNVNGSGMGHLTRCLAYARCLRGRARPFFFSLASAIEVIEEMGFEADYFVSHYWSGSSTFAWNSELAVRFGLVLERVRPAVIVFDGTWPFQGFMAACEAYGSPAMVWSNRGLLKAETEAAPVDEALFDLVIQPGELGSSMNNFPLAGGGKRLVVPPVCLLEKNDLMARAAAREALSLEPDGRYVLFSLGPGNLKDVTGIGHGLIRAFEAQGFRVVWAQAPISVRDVALPAGVKPLSVYPLVRYLKGFDVFVGAAGYNTCCEVVQAAIPTLIVPNEQLVDDQMRRAQMVASVMPALVSACETESERTAAVQELLGMMAEGEADEPAFPMNGASLAAEAIIALVAEGGGDNDCH